MTQQATARKAAARGLRVIFVDDEAPLREFMKSELPRLGHEVEVCEDGQAALKMLGKATFDAAILDLRMPGLSGLDVLEHLKKVSPDTEAVVMTGHASIETATMAMRLGAADYITKPCKLADIEAVLTRAAGRRDLKNKALASEERAKRAEGPTTLVGASEPMKKVQQFLGMLAPTDATVLILGETGCGKELAARALWQQSKRAGMPFIPVNCGALAEHLVESELFGHVKGAFTGADRDHKGIFEVANGGTVFLDEVGELPKNVQVKLLRFLEAKEIRRVGDSKPFVTDVRVVCATHRDLRQMIRDDQFREDLYFRINTFEARLPSLRERKADIADLARHLLARAARRTPEQVAGLLSPEVVRALEGHDWPGNVRELANVMEHAWILSGGGRVGPEHLPHLVRRGGSGAAAMSAAPTG
ncbi:MAG: sigma-54 dependent transcriptional regulator, partial [Gemmataceae bacterium]|nr:sigma-54 dependent transcriptional regulator [Gemmataceae bacterium]